jgi:hypothetical protein
MVDTKDVKQLSPTEREQIKTEAVAKAVPHVDQAQKSRAAYVDYQNEIYTKYHTQLQRIFLDDLESHKNRDKLKEYLGKDETYESRKAQIENAKPGDFKVDLASKWLTSDGRDKLANNMTSQEIDKISKLNMQAYLDANSIVAAIEETLKKHGLEFNRLHTDSPGSEADANRRANNKEFRNELIEGLITPKTTKEPEKGPGYTPGKQPEQGVKKVK